MKETLAEAGDRIASRRLERLLKEWAGDAAEDIHVYITGLLWAVSYGCQSTGPDLVFLLAATDWAGDPE